ncbi:MAG: C39 family peptidase [Ruminococcus sp.]|nr:C39 family peptidase [Ruminococcus sp.]
MKGIIMKTAAAAVLAAAAMSSCTRVETYREVKRSGYAGSAEVSEPAAQSTEVTTEAATELPTEPFRLDIGVPEGYEPTGKHVLEGFDAVLQEPELPTGCEVTSLTADLNYLGFDIDKLTLCDEYMPIALAGEVVMDEAYVGNPRYDGFGCNANVMVQTADSYFASVDSPCYAEDLTGTELSQLFWQIDNGRPVLAWSTIDLTVSYPEYVWTAGNGKDLVFDWYQHCMVIYGYDMDEQIVYAADPLKGNVTYPIAQFENIYGIMGKQAVVICGDSGTEGHHETTDAERAITIEPLNKQQENEEAASGREGV